MGILDTLLSGQNAQLITQFARNSGIDEADVQKVIGQLLPAVSQGIKTNASTSEGLGALVNALGKFDYQRYLDHPEQLTEPAATDKGNAILGHVLGSRDVSRNVAEQAAQTTGVDSGIIKQLLPLVATAVMGALSKETKDSPIGGSGQSLGMNNILGADASPVVGMITAFLDTNNDGDITDDLFNMARKFF